ncbi:MAG: WD40/YVTN/BNR-like repeat-containing protein, partial [Terriglobales bacterium]
MWEFPLAFSPFDHNTLYAGSQFVHVTHDGGQSWQTISPDLTRNDKSKQQGSGGLTQDNIGVEYFDTVFSIAESPKQKGEIWAGTNDGLVQLTRDGGKNWANLTKNLPDLPQYATISSIEPSRFDAATAYLTADGHLVDNRDPYVYRTTDAGATWTKITHGLPAVANGYAHQVIEDPERKGLLFLGTEGGVYVSFDAGDQWQPLQMNLPHVTVYGLTVQTAWHDLD